MKVVTVINPTKEQQTAIYEIVTKYGGWKLHDIYISCFGLQVEFYGYCQNWKARLKNMGYFVTHSEQHLLPSNDFHVDNYPLAILTIELKPEFDYESCLLYAGWIED
jgi:hypothetical protein